MRICLLIVFGDKPPLDAFHVGLLVLVCFLCYVHGFFDGFLRQAIISWHVWFFGSFLFSIPCAWFFVFLASKPPLVAMSVRLFIFFCVVDAMCMLCDMMVFEYS